MGKFFNVGFLVLLLFILCAELCFCSNSTFGCVEGERQALMKFKHSVHDPARWLSSWEGKDCCKWRGITCDRITGHVRKLDLRRTDTYWLENVSMYSNQLKAPEVNSSLLDLKYLSYLDLSGQAFRGTIPKFFGSMKRLRYLYLNSSYFSGTIPQHLGNLTSLRVLDLSDNYYYGRLTVDDVKWVSQLSSLQHLDVSYIDMREVRNLIQVLNMLPSLSQLLLSSCGLDNTHLSHSPFNSSFLSGVRYWNLSGNLFYGSIPPILQNMTSLIVLDLSFNQFNSSIPLWLDNFERLVHLNLRYNQFNDIEGGLSSILNTSCYLKLFDLSENQIHGEILGSHEELTGCIEYNLETLSLSYNKISGRLPDWLCQLNHLKYLDLGMNSFYGSIPSSFEKLSALIRLHLWSSQLNGNIPESLGQLSNLQTLDISFNSLEGPIPESLGQLSNLQILNMSSNSLKGPIPESLGQLSNLQTLDISSNSLEGPIPESLGQLSNLQFLGMSSNSFEGIVSEVHFANLTRLTRLYLSHNHISGLLSKFPSTLQYIDISSNLISGSLPQNIGDMMPGLESLLLSSNLISGPIPDSLCNIDSLKVLDLSKNRLFGKIPHCWRASQELSIINLSSNKLSGVIPSSIGNLSSLLSLHLDNNSLHSELPLSLRNCTKLSILDLGENGFSGNIPKWIGKSLQRLQILRLHINMFNGSIPSRLCLLSRLQILDVASNNLVGKIPHCFGNFHYMVGNLPIEAIEENYMQVSDNENVRQVMKGRVLDYVATLKFEVNMDLSSNNLIGFIPEALMFLSELHGFNLSQNHLSGTIPVNISNMKALKSLDFSDNHLSGKIPESMSVLTSLSYLNLSYNNLSGQIPTNNQLQILDDPSIYIGNSQLCGAPLPKKCQVDEPAHLADEPTQAPTITVYEEEDEFEKMWFYIVIMLGFAIGFWGVLGVLLFKKSWRYAYFRYVDEAKDWIYVAIVVRVARLKKKMENN